MLKLYCSVPKKTKHAQDKSEWSVCSRKIDIIKEEERLNEALKDFIGDASTLESTT